ncbi:MAG: hypothetical protein EBR09_10185 [Proteobacteria bacterium]|jgi:hypothetical protein|nr:hypothetical protein [Pseudomonadota bacterium]
MKLTSFVALVSVGLFTQACGSSAENSVVRSVESLKPEPLTDSGDTRLQNQNSLRDCMISGFLAHHRAQFSQIKAKCYSAGLSKCGGQSSCETEYAASTEELMKKATGVDCDSGYCSVLF